MGVAVMDLKRSLEGAMFVSVWCWLVRVGLVWCWFVKVGLTFGVCLAGWREGGKEGRREGGKEGRRDTTNQE